VATELHLLLIRHAIAEERGAAWPDDEQRPLSHDGTRKWKRATHGLARVAPTVDHLLSSPLTRTFQTAEILAKALSPAPKVQLLDALRPETRPGTLVTALRAKSLKGTVALVGHEPMLSELAALLLHLQGPLEFRKGAAMLLVTNGFGTRGPARLEWFLTPRVLREMAGKD
jgi:phosphohistidine phosphatase